MPGLLTLASLIALTPLLLFPSGWRVLALLGLPVLWGIRWARTGHPLPPTPYTRVLLVFASMMLVSTVATFDLTLSAPRLASLLLGIALLYSVAEVARTPQGYRLCVFGLLGASALFILVALVGTHWPQKFGPLLALTQLLPPLLRGLPGAVEGFAPAEVAGTLLWLIWLAPAVAYSAWHTAARPLALAASALTLALGGLLLMTQSRSAWFGLLGGALVFVAARGPRTRRVLGQALAVGALLLACALILIPNLFTTLFPMESGTSRAELWTRAWHALQDFPLTGIGVGMFRYILPRLYPLPNPDPLLDVHAHNELLQAGLDLGLLGLGAFVALHVLAVRQALQRFHTTPDPFTRATLLAILAGLASHAVFGLTDAIALGAKPGLIFWLLLGLVALPPAEKIEYNTASARPSAAPQDT